MSNRAPLIAAIVLLLLPVLYVGSYLALVVPKGTVVEVYSTTGIPVWGRYRVTSNSANIVACKVYWPLEQIDRKMRPGAWEPRRLILGLKQQSSFLFIDPPASP